MKPLQEVKETMKHSNTFDDFLTHQLRAKNDYLHDDGFTARLMAALPQPRKALNPWLEKLIVFLPVTLISLWVLARFPWFEVIQPLYAQFLLMDLAGLVLASFAIMLTLVLIPACWVFNRDRL